MSEERATGGTEGTAAGAAPAGAASAGSRPAGGGREESGGGPATRTLRLRIEEMDCADCARRVRERLLELEGVREATGNPLSRRLEVSFEEGRTDDRRIRREIGKLGYVARDEPEEPVRPAGTWRSAGARRTYVAGALFAAGILLEATGVRAALPLPALPGAPAAGLAELLLLAAAATAGWNFFPAGIRAARLGSLDMNFLMTVAIAGAVGIGAFTEAAAIAVLFSGAELLEEFAVDRARRSLEALMELSPDAATVVRDGAEVRVAAEEVGEGEEVVVRPGERIPADGVVVAGASAVDESPITGESMPVEKSAGDEVFAGTIAAEGVLQVRVERAGERTTLAHIIHLVEEAESHRAPSERFVERFARRYTPAVTGAAVLVAALPPLAFGAPWGEWFVRGLTLLVIACPCALVISTPVAVVSGITAAARNGVLIKGGVHLESLGEVEVIAFDKTGTLTRGHPDVVAVVPAPGRGEEEVLALAAAVEAGSEHPIGRAIRRAAAEQGIEPAAGSVSEFRGEAGRGARAAIDGVEHRVGGPGFFDAAPWDPSLVEDLASRGLTPVLVGRPEEVAGVVALADRLRPGAAEAVRRLRRAGVRRTVLLTGDTPETARAIAAEAGIDEVHAGLLPAEKVERIRALEAEAGPVAMVGDGVNDAPALTAATVGIAMGAAGSDAALETADAALMGDDLLRLPYLYELSHRGRGVIRQNIAASLGLKLLLAAGVPLGVVSLILAVLVGDMGASLAVTGNALRLARLRA